MTAAEAFKALLADAAATLKSSGYSRRGLTFFRERSGNYGLIQFQKSQKTTAKIVVFTANVGVVSGRLARFFGGTVRSGQPPDSVWHWYARLGALRFDGQDKWWILGGTQELDRVAREIKSALVTLAQPELDKYLQDESLRDLWLTGRSPGLTDLQRLKYLAILVKALGPQERLPSILADLRRVSRASAAWMEAKLQAGASA